MSDQPANTFSRDAGWRPWRMGELRPATVCRDGASGGAPQPAAVDLDALRQSARDQGREEGYQAGLAQGRTDGHREGFASGREEGLQQGLAEGRRQGAAEQQAALARELAALSPLVREIGAAFDQFDGEVADSLVALALATGRQLARDSLDADPAAVLAIVRELLHYEPALQGRPRLWLHPRDLDLVEQHLGDELHAAGWQLQPDDQISRGGCRVSSASAELDASWESRWAAVCARVRQRGTGELPP